MQKKNKFNSDGVASSNMKCKWGYGGAYDGVWRSLLVMGVSCVDAFGGNLVSVAMKMF
jgi:hypothetical protein